MDGKVFEDGIWLSHRGDMQMRLQRVSQGVIWLVTPTPHWVFWLKRLVLSRIRRDHFPQAIDSKRLTLQDRQSKRVTAPFRAEYYSVVNIFICTVFRARGC